jgi:VanZ family protein
MKATAWRWLSAAFLLFMLWVAVSADRGALPVWLRDIYRFPGGDWVGHFVLYGILAFLGARAFPQRLRLGPMTLPLSLLLVLLLATLEEISQFWFPLRTPDLRDLAFGFAGAAVGTWLGLKGRAKTRAFQNKNSAP